MVTIGETFRLGIGAHLWMVITVPEGANGAFIMVNMASLDAHIEDTTCVLRVGDHPDVHHDSVIRYGFAREWWNAGDRGHDYWTARGAILPSQPLSQTLLRRIQNGALSSHFFKRKFIPQVQASLV